LNKQRVTRLWFVGLAISAIGFVLLMAAGLMGANGGASFVLGWIVVVTGAIVQIAAWGGAIQATARLKQWGWCTALLVLGLAGLLFVVMIAYMVYGPTTYREAASAPVPA